MYRMNELNQEGSSIQLGQLHRQSENRK